MTRKIPVALIAVSLLAGCASSSKEMSPEASRGPFVIDAKSKPETVELNRYFQPTEPQQFFAEIQDFTAPVVEAKIQIAGTGIELPMQKVGGTTWRAELNPEQLRRLAVSGRTIEYKGQIIARNQNGVVGTAQKPVQVEIKAPSFESSG